MRRARWPCGQTSKCRCGPVDWPRLPTVAICSPAATWAPTPGDGVHVAVDRDRPVGVAQADP
jgi:hypothetical protein